MELKRLIEIIEAAGYEAGPESYRGQFNKPDCVGLRVDNIIDAVAEMSANASKEERDFIKTVRSDNMGKGYVLYWPSVIWSDDE